MRVVRGTINHRSVEVVHTGVGENTCRERIEKFLEDAQFDILDQHWICGLAQQRTAVNDLLVAQNFRLSIGTGAPVAAACRFARPTCVTCLC